MTLPPGLRAALICAALALVGLPPPARADDEQSNDQLLCNLNVHRALAGQFSLFGNFAYMANPHDFARYRFGVPAVAYQASGWLRWRGGLDAYYTDNFSSANTLELRPFLGVNLLARRRVVFYSYTRYEYRATEDRETHDWDEHGRIRSRWGVDVPLTAQAGAWQPKTFYVFSDVEPFYRFDEDEWGPVWVRVAPSYVANRGLRVELIYTAQFTRSAPGGSLDHTDHFLELSIRMALDKGVLERLTGPGE